MDHQWIASYYFKGKCTRNQWKSCNSHEFTKNVVSTISAVDFSTNSERSSYIHVHSWVGPQPGFPPGLSERFQKSVDDFAHGNALPHASRRFVQARKPLESTRNGIFEMN
jgi:hypothetical protein